QISSPVWHVQPFSSGHTRTIKVGDYMRIEILFRKQAVMQISSPVWHVQPFSSGHTRTIKVGDYMRIEILFR
ncbi:hypothetical protein CQA86_32620, partial [Klebsiella pneumoniae]